VALLIWSGVCFWQITDMKNPEIGMQITVLKNQEVLDLYTEFCISFFGGLFLGFAISAELITLISIPSRASG